MHEGDRVGDRFLLMQRLHGGRRTNEVWLAQDENTGREVVLKRSGLLSGEPRAMAKFNHPYVVSLYDVVSIDGDDWFAMEYAQRGSLAGIAPMPPERVARVGAQIAGALVALHKKGVVHCDVKPGNIVISEDGAAKLTDFGAAYRIHETITPDTAISYTVGYAAPEVLKGNPEPKSDVYSLAVTLSALVEGTLAGQETETSSTPARVEPAVQDIVVDVAARPLRKVLSAMRQRDPRDRPNAATAQWMLMNVTRHQTRRRASLAAMAAGTAGVMLIAVAVMLGWPPFDNEPEPTPVIGDHRTADPCALLDEPSFDRFGHTYLDRDYASFEQCAVLVTRAGRLEIDVEVGFDTSRPPVNAPITMGSVAGIAALPSTDNDCRRAVLLRDDSEGVFVLVSVHADSVAPLCEMANIATQTAVERLADGPLPRRSPPLPADSLLWRDACELGEKVPAAVLDVDIGGWRASFGDWSCDWSDAIGDVYLTVGFDRGPH